jgi:cytochrome c biogenesis protein CcmG, thiol:disulfide interchange protein DsbE
MRRTWTTTAGLIVIALFVALLGYGVLRSNRAKSLDAAVASGKRVAPPSVNLPWLDRSEHATLADWRGKVVVLNFWASWCPPCREEAPLLARWQPQLTSAGGTILGVDTLDVASDARAFMAKNKLDYPSLRDRGGDTARAFGVAAYPESIVIDRKGRVAAVMRGPLDDTFMRDHVRPLLKEPA